MQVRANRGQLLEFDWCKPYIMLEADSFFKPKESGGWHRDKVDVAVIDKACETIEQQSDVPIMIDIESEASDLIGNRAEALKQLKILLTRFKSNLPDRRIGLYRIIPTRTWDVPVKWLKTVIDMNLAAFQACDERRRQWKQANRDNARALIGLVDFVVPSVYSFFENHEFYWWYALENINEAVAIAEGKPVYPIVLSTLYSGEKYPLPTWESVVSHVAAHPGTDELWIYCNRNAEHNNGWADVLSRTRAPA